VPTQATDHENATFDAAFASKGAVFSKFALRATDMVPAGESGLAAKFLKAGKHLLPVVFDYAVLTHAEEFFSTPGSTFSAAVCRWRAVEDSVHQAKTVDGCDFVNLWTFSDQCEEKEAKWECP
jgi:hypothetical protein